MNINDLRRDHIANRDREIQGKTAAELASIKSAAEANEGKYAFENGGRTIEAVFLKAKMSARSSAPNDYSISLFMANDAGLVPQSTITQTNGKQSGAGTTVTKSQQGYMIELETLYLP